MEGLGHNGHSQDNSTSSSILVVNASENLSSIPSDKQVAVVEQESEVGSFLIDQYTSEFNALKEKYKTVRIAVEDAAIYNIKPSSLDSSKYRVFQQEFGKVTDKYLEHLISLTKKNSFKYPDTPEGRKHKTSELKYVDFYRIADILGMVEVYNQAQIDHIDLNKQLFDFVVSIDKNDLTYRYISACICAVSQRMLPGNYSTSPQKFLSEILQNINKG